MMFVVRNRIMMLLILFISLWSNLVDSLNIESKFIFTTCQSGSEKLLKNEILIKYPNYKFAFSRPSLITFKDSSNTTNILPNIELKSIFTQSYGVSLGSCTTINEIIEKAKLTQEQLSLDSNRNIQLRLHIWGRNEGGMSSEHPLAIVENKKYLDNIKQQIYTLGNEQSIWLESTPTTINRLKTSFEESNMKINYDDYMIASDGECVFDVVVPTGTLYTKRVNLYTYM